MKLEGSKLSFGAAKIPAALNPATEIMQTAPNKFEIKRSDVLKYTADMSAVLQQAAMAPRRNAAGEIDCFRFFIYSAGFYLHEAWIPKWRLHQKC